MFQFVNLSDSDFGILDPVLEEGLDNHVKEDVRNDVACSSIFSFYPKCEVNMLIGQKA